MAALNIRNIGDQRKIALDAEAKAQGVSLSDLVRRFLDEGIEKARSAREREEWLVSAREGLAFEAEDLRRRGPSLAHFRNVPGSGEGH